jgi:hypothetical protein
MHVLLIYSCYFIANFIYSLLQYYFNSLSHTKKKVSGLDHDEHKLMNSEEFLEYLVTKD